MTNFFDGLIALMVAFFVNAMVLLVLRRRLPPEDAFFLARIYLWTLGLRYVLALFLNIQSTDSAFAATFWGDSGTYDANGHLLSLVWRGEAVVRPWRLGVSGYGFTYFVAGVYYIFGRNQLLIQLLNGTIGALSIVFIYMIGKELFDTEVARWAARFMAFFPQMLFWSCAMYKDPAIILCLAVCIHSILKLRTAFSLGRMLVFLSASFALMTLRFYVFYFMAFATLGTFVFAQRRRLVAQVLSWTVFLGVFVAAFSFAVNDENLAQQTAFFDLEKVQISRLDLAQSASSGFGRGADVSTPAGALATLPTGLLYLMLAPFPWAVSGIRQILVLPEMLVWYALIPYLLRGLAYTLRWRFRAALPILVFTAALTVAYALFQGNVGTAYRQRTQITMFYFIFIGVGLTLRHRRAESLTRAAALPARPALKTDPLIKV